MDDIIVYGTNQAEHDERLEAVLTRLQQADVTLIGRNINSRKIPSNFWVKLLAKTGFALTQVKCPQ